MFALLEVVGEGVELDNHRAPVQLIVAPAAGAGHVSCYMIYALFTVFQAGLVNF